MTKSFSGRGNVERINAIKVEWQKDNAGVPVKFKEISKSEFTLQADLVLLAMGFAGPQRNGLLKQLGLELGAKNNVRIDESGATDINGIFAAGDIASGPSLVVRAIAAGRAAAATVDDYLTAD